MIMQGGKKRMGERSKHAVPSDRGKRWSEENTQGSREIGMES